MTSSGSPETASLSCASRDTLTDRSAAILSSAMGMAAPGKFQARGFHVTSVPGALIAALVGGNGRIALNWAVISDTLPKPAVKVLLNLAAIAIDALPRGGDQLAHEPQQRHDDHARGGVLHSDAQVCGHAERCGDIQEDGRIGFAGLVHGLECLRRGGGEERKTVHRDAPVLAIVRFQLHGHPAHRGGAVRRVRR